MLNFLLGTLAGAIIACVLTIAAARQPEIQSKLGLVAPTVPMTPAAAPRAADLPDCRPAQTAPVGSAQEILFNRRRFWSVAP